MEVLKKEFDYIFVILVYRNYEDLEECLNSISETVRDYKVVVVNAFYDDQTNEKIKQVAEAYSCDFMKVENKGYSYGNNSGIEYAYNKYNFKYIVVSNPDIIVRSFPDDIKKSDDIIAPKIIAKSGKSQNPMNVCEVSVAEYLCYKGFKVEFILLTYLGIVINKIIREISIFVNRYLRRRNRYQIYCAHGSFVIISKEVIKRLGIRLYDENMFLFAEEGVLAKKAAENGFKIMYDESFFVNHKEDGSMKLSDFSINKELAKANIYFYEKYVLGKQK